MATFLTTAGVNAQLDKLIKGTQDRLILISPYLQFSDLFKHSMTELMKQKPDVRIVYRENKLKEGEKNWLADQIGVRTNICSSLHAKCYINEQEAIITSMNLFEYSQLNNDEMGIHITRCDDNQLYLATYKEAKRLIQISQEVRVTKETAAEIAVKKSAKFHSSTSKKTIPTGYCIRTGEPIKFDIEKPLSAAAFRAWDKFGDFFYPEKFCHFSGEPTNGKNCFDMPVLKKNWKAAQDVHDC
ncbi:MAG: phospholipase D family protein [Chitinophagaceae bacterium]